MSEYIQQGDPANIAEEVKILYQERAISGSEQLVLFMKAQQEREREKKRELEQFSNKVSFSNVSLVGPICNWPVLALYADSFTIKKEYNEI